MVYFSPAVTRRAALRGFLSACSVAAGVVTAPNVLHAQTLALTVTSGRPENAEAFWSAPRWVWLTRPASGETIRVVYWRDGQLLQPGYEAVSWFMRDIRFERMIHAKDRRISWALDNGRIDSQQLTPWMLMDPVLLDIIYAYCAWLHRFGIHQPLLLTSAFRHLVTNEITEGAARDSWHLKGGAADIIIPSVPIANAATFGRWLAGGGVGLYMSKRFVHLDRGRVRSWTS